jgi:methylated-DNA-[protein]-cysteine S-methyltransferase
MSARTADVAHALAYAVLPTPIGDLLAIGEGGSLREIRFARTWRARDISPRWAQGSAVLAETARQLDEYFAGARRRFDLPLAARGNGFQQRVWDALRRIEYGTTTSYGEIARRIGHPDAARAVGAANGANPIPIVVPCHRVIGADGSLTGFGGGLPLKQWLLQHEGALPQGALFQEAF